MPQIHYILKDGSTRTVEATSGHSVMETAIRHNVRGIDAECGGCCSCATCHVHVAEQWWDKIGDPQETEKEVLEFADAVGEYSRLSCQILVTEDLDGLVVTMPESQG